MCKIAICDDDKEYREKIKTVIKTEGILSSNEIRFYEYESGKELLEDADILHDLIFMDMRMPGLDGNKTVLKLREYNEAAILVFCSGCFEPTPDSINVGQPFRYIMKDLHDRSLKKEIPMILLKVKLCCGDSSVTVTSAGRIMRIHTEDILYGRCICCSRQQASVLSYYDGALREYLSEKLPEYMVPQNYHFMAQLPTLSNGKINRKKLREDFKEETSVIRFSKAVTETEEKLLDIWKRMFGYENLGTEDNYFVLGGDSLIATKLISDIQKEFGCKIMISDIFENVTIKLLAQKIDLVRQNVIMEDIEMECGEI